MQNLDIFNTYIYDEEHALIASLPGLCAITVGMGIHIDSPFARQIVTEVNLKITSDLDAKPGLHVFTKKQ